MNSRKIIQCMAFIMITWLTTINSQELLDGIPIVFKIDGNVTYTPTSGVTNILGYKLKIGYNKNKWIGIKFMSQTSGSNYDILVVQRANNPVSGFYETTVGDYFVSSGRQDKLISDSINNMDKHTSTLSEGSYFFLDISRTKGDTQGEDWQPNDFVQICFLTSDKDFNQNQWSDLTESCYGYSVTQDFVSTYKGRKIGQMNVDGTSSPTYGGIQGPILTLQLFWYCAKSTLSSSDVIINIGDQIDPDIVGYDYHVCGSGDYFGLNSETLTPDTTWNGYNDGTCEKISSASSTIISYSRRVYTDDQFDGIIYNETNICIKVGSNSDCQTLQFENLYPIMTVNSSFILYEKNGVTLLIAILVYMLIFLKDIN